MPKIFTSETQKIGELGEELAVKFLMKHGFSIVDRNYTKKWGELDIVAEKDKKIYFIEVKSVSSSFAKATADRHEMYRPEENMHPWKMKRMARAIQTYILSKKLENREWQVDLLVVYLNGENGEPEIKVVSDIIL